MKDIRRKEMAITDRETLTAILTEAKYITIAMCDNNEPYLVCLSHGYDETHNCIYFHCAVEGKKMDILRQNPVVWGQAMKDEGYVRGKCNHLYATVQFRGTVQFLTDPKEKMAAMEVMIESLEDHPEPVKKGQATEKAIGNVTIGRIDIQCLTGKKSKEVTL